MKRTPFKDIKIDGFYQAYIIYDYAKIILSFRLTAEPDFSNGHTYFTTEEFESVARIKNGNNIMVAFDVISQSDINRGLSDNTLHWLYELDEDEIHDIIAKHI